MLKEYICKLSNVKVILCCNIFYSLGPCKSYNCNLLVNIVTCYFVIVSYKYCINLSVSSVFACFFIVVVAFLLFLPVMFSLKCI